jgi:hypothetical protein
MEQQTDGLGPWPSGEASELEPAGRVETADAGTGAGEALVEPAEDPAWDPEGQTDRAAEPEDAWEQEQAREPEDEDAWEPKDAWEHEQAQDQDQEQEQDHAKAEEPQDSASWTEPDPAGEPPGDPGPRPETGEPRVDAALARLGELAGRPVTEHRPIFEDVHRRLRDVLGELDTREPSDPRDATRPASRAGR